MTPGCEVQDHTTKHLIKTSLTMTTTITTKSTSTTGYYLTMAMNIINGHVIVITTSTTSLHFGQFSSDFWKRVGTLKLRAVLWLNALFF